LKEAKMMRQRLCREDRGFTMVELLVAMTAISGAAWVVHALT
jgi:prepilin-type N-terminal cleavage/methylation domain-containing protein